MSIRIEVENPPTDEARQIVRQGLIAYNNKAHPATDDAQIQIIARDEQDQVVGGAIGNVQWGELYVDILWVAEAQRGEGIGFRLMQAVEAEAERRDCHRVHLGSMSSQAPGFYRKIGYTEYAWFAGNPRQPDRHMFYKDLWPAWIREQYATSTAAEAPAEAPAEASSPASPRISLAVERQKAYDKQRVVSEGLGAFNNAVLPAAYQPLSVFAVDEEGKVRGGVVCSIYWQALAIDSLWLEESLRGQGLGAQMMAQVEEIAREEGCRLAHVDTMSFQARAFYEKLGYTVFGTLTGYPEGFERYYMQKPLLPAAADT